MKQPIDDFLCLPSIRWVVAYVGGWQPLEVTQYLSRMGYLPYSPQETQIVYRGRTGHPNGRRERKIVHRSLFGGYLFVGEVIRPLSRSTHPRIFNILGDSRGPFYVRTEALIAIRRAEIGGAWDYSRGIGEKFPIGRQVTIKRGHFAEFQAVVAQVERSGKVRVRLNLFGREHETSIDAKALEPAA